MYMWKYLYVMYVLDISIGLYGNLNSWAASMRPCCQSWPPRPPAPEELRPGSNETGSRYNRGRNHSVWKKIDAFLFLFSEGEDSQLFHLLHPPRKIRPKNAS